MLDDKFEWLSDKECREAKIELSFKILVDRFLKYHANSKEEYARRYKSTKQLALFYTR